MTTRHQLLAGTAALCLAVLAAGWFLLASPRRAEVAQLKDQTIAQQATNSSLQSQVTNLLAIQRQLPAQQAKANALSAKVPADPALVPLIHQLSKAATDSSVMIAGITPTRPQPVTGAAGLSGLQLSLTVNGDYASLEGFELALEGLQRSFLVTQITMAESRGAVTSSTATGGISATIIGRVLTGTPGAGATPAGTSTN
jgi:Tfp pilus assembly protein PilO